MQPSSAWNAKTVINPCPTCGRRFDFPLTGCVTFVADELLASSGGNCPDCGTSVVVARSSLEVAVSDPLSLATTQAEKEAVLIVDLPLSVRCRHTLDQLGIGTVGELVLRQRAEIRAAFNDAPARFEELEELCSAHGLRWLHG